MSNDLVSDCCGKPVWYTEGGIMRCQKCDKPCDVQDERARRREYKKSEWERRAIRARRRLLQEEGR